MSQADAAMAIGPAPRLIVSDIDGTFINSADRVPPRVRDAIHKATAQGMHFALATGRPFRWLQPVLEQIAARPVCVTSNGAVIYDCAADEVLTAAEISPELMEEVYHTAQEIFAPYGGVSIAAEYAGYSARQDPTELFVAADNYAHTWADSQFISKPTEQVWQKPAVKFLLRNPAMSANQMYELLAEHIDSRRAHVTYSIDAGLLEVAAPGVNKAAGLEFLANHLGVAAADVIAFGDMPNDIEMLRWAGRGVAVENAHPVVRQAADMVTGSNDDAGIAQIIERWL